MHPLIKKYQNHLIIGYILALIFSFFFVRYALDEQDVKVASKKVEKDVFEVKPVSVYLEIPSQGVKYRAKLRNVDSVLDLFEYARTHEDFWYEKTAYTYGTEIDKINGINPREGYSWKVFDGEEDITYNISKVYLTDERTYIVKLIPVDK